MSEGPKSTGIEPVGKPRSGVLTGALWGAAIVGVAGVLYIMVQSSTKAPSRESTGESASTLQTSFTSKVQLPAEPRPAPDYTFYDSAGKAARIADFKGKVVVMNIWATWCAPCVAEMPTLAKLKAAYAGKEVEVVVVSIDSETSAAKARLFIARHEPLAFYHDREMKLPFKINAAGAPTTVIYGRDGLEKARVAGEADWSGADARALVDEALAGD
ncbi:TlpA family protein disulfide reductase [Phenylobacterium sp.]|jgi:thiol-disulfide isomerase/thioredoxin|uniref:TlpA family protein disulfide reductase n=1 Tax=Phenylobacterium sp. TaxID=1871053 RepID=UPI0037C907D4